MLISVWSFVKTEFARTLAQLEDDVAPCEAQMENWKTNLAVMAAKERQYLQQCANYKVLCTDIVCNMVKVVASLSLILLIWLTKGFIFITKSN